ncbi:hypothetical protein WN944_023044 [Citrus x changshan-huyou]|uniref:Uncharacterized protein n=1 Tax=Citrus x changshan-huyou TaxID=2935761 RepID=A0AAP0N2H9_9ROSI
MEIAATVLATIRMASGGGYSKMKREEQMVYNQGPVLHRYYRDGVLDVFVGERDLHDDDFGHECYQRVVVYGDSFGGINTILTMLCAWGF